MKGKTRIDKLTWTRRLTLTKVISFSMKKGEPDLEKKVSKMEMEAEL